MNNPLFLTSYKNYKNLVRFCSFFIDFSLRRKFRIILEIILLGDEYMRNNYKYKKC